MGYTTEFRGSFQIDRPLDDETYNLLKGLATTRRMARNVDPKYGIQGEFYIDGSEFLVQYNESNVVDYNRPPMTQPSLWCQWIPTEDRDEIEWDGGENFYNYIEWIEYLISKVLAPRGYKLNGEVEWRGEDWDDNGTITIVDNVVDGRALDIDNSINQLLEENQKLREENERLKSQEVASEKLKRAIKDELLAKQMLATGFKGTLKEYKEIQRGLIE
jgi:hypothetical protein